MKFLLLSQRLVRGISGTTTIAEKLVALSHVEKQVRLASSLMNSKLCEEVDKLRVKKAKNTLGLAG